MSTLKTDAIQTLTGKPILNSTGSVLQVVQATKTNVVTTTSESYVSANLFASITPSSFTSRIMITCHATIQNDTVNGGTSPAIFRNGSFLWFTVLQQFSSGGSNVSVACLNYLDSPDTTSTVTYQLYFSRYLAGTSYLYDGAIQLWEIA